MSTNSNAPAMGEHGTGRGIPFAAATDASNLSAARKRGNASARYHVVPPGGGDASFITVKGRVAPVRALRESPKARAAIALLEKHGWLVRLPERMVVRGAARKEAWQIVRARDVV